MSNDNGSFLALQPADMKRVRVWILFSTFLLSLFIANSIGNYYGWFHTFTLSLKPNVCLAVFMGALICEYVDSSLGMGYGTTLTPALLLAGFEPLEIVPCVLLSEFATGLAATVMHHHDGNVNFFKDKQAKSAAIMLSLLSIIGTLMAVTVAVNISKFMLKCFIGSIVLAAGITTLATSGRQFRYRPGHMIILGGIAAFNKGMSGGGYGPLVTSGQVVSGLGPKKAVAITSFAESLTCFVGLAAYLYLGNSFRWDLALPLTTGALLSVPMATLTIKHMQEKTLRSAVGVTTCLLGILLIAKLF